MDTFDSIVDGLQVSKYFGLFRKLEKMLHTLGTAVEARVATTDRQLGIIGNSEF